MTPDELAALRNEMVKLHALISASADMCSTVEGSDPKLERVQALLDVTLRYSSQVMLLAEVASAPKLAIVS